LRHFLFRIEKILKELDGQNPNLKMLKINGNDLMKEGIKAGPRLGYILGILLERVIANPGSNQKEKLHHIKDSAKSLLNSSEKLKTEIDEQSDDQ
jgi:tRNA nucleotidyltransferase (CCA-adding enzyme)